MHLISLLVLLLSLFPSAVNSTENYGALAIVIDDLGYSQDDFQALSLPKQISFSILPFTPQGKRLAEQAHQQGREILAHVPMQAKRHNHKLGKGALLSRMQEQEFKATLQSALDDLPYARGINNHMGSALTEQVAPMRWTMEVLRARGLYFIDSRTTAKTIAESTAKLLGVPTLRRHVFLDNIKTELAMQHQFQRALQLSKEQQMVVIIAHPYPQTIRFLQKKFQHQTGDSQLVKLTEVIPMVQRLAMEKRRKAYLQGNNITLANYLSAPQ